MSYHMTDLTTVEYDICILIIVMNGAYTGKITHRAKINPDRWDSHFRDEIRYCYPVGASDTKLEKSHLIKV